MFCELATKYVMFIGANKQKSLRVLRCICPLSLTKAYREVILSIKAHTRSAGRNKYEQ